LPDSFHIKIVTISRKADGYYVTLSLEGKSVSTLTTIVKLNLKNTLDINYGTERFLDHKPRIIGYNSSILPKVSEAATTLQKCLSRKKKGSNRWLKAVKSVGKQYKKLPINRNIFILLWKYATNIVNIITWKFIATKL